MKSVRQTLCIVVLLLVSLPALSARNRKPITPEIGFKSPPIQLTKKLPDITGWQDDGTYIESIKKEGDTLARPHFVDAKSGKEKGEKKPDVRWDDFRSVVPDGFEVAKPSISNRKNTLHIWSKANDLYLLDAGKKEFKRLTNNSSEEKNPTFSPTGDWVAFTRDHDLFAIDLSAGKEYRFTNDGTDAVYSGYAAWVYYEEIFGRRTRHKAFWWSTDGNKLAFYRFDETNVPVFPIYNSAGQHGNLERTHYPEVGDPNPQVRIGIVDIDGCSITWADFNEKDDQYFGAPFWTPDSKQLWVQWMNRRQNDLKIYSIDCGSGGKKEITDETQDSWVDWYDDIHFLKNDKGFIVKSDRDGWAHFYLHAMDGALKNRITEGKWQVEELVYVDDGRGALYFTAEREASTRTDLYRIGLDGKGLERLTFGGYTHDVSMSPQGSYFITTYSNVSTPTKKAICDSDGRMLRELGDSYQKDMDEYDIAQRRLFEIPTSDGCNLPAIIMLPPNMDSTKRYPVLISVYGGPGSRNVSDSWQLLMTNQALASEGLIQFTLDHRASKHFGKAGAALMYHNLGKWELNDYKEGVKWLREQPFVDSTRICITGGSYGGYVTCMALTAGADYFPYGIANYSITDWRLYDTHYTERYMGTPTDNPDGYRNGSVIPYVNDYKGLLRIVHGSTDDNVHCQNSLQLADTLEASGKHFELMIYPNERHGWGPPKSEHQRMETMRFYYDHLLKKEFPEELFKMSAGRRQG